MKLTGLVYVGIIISEACRLLGASCRIGLGICKYDRAFLSDEVLHRKSRRIVQCRLLNTSSFGFAVPAISNDQVQRNPRLRSRYITSRLSCVVGICRM